MPQPYYFRKDGKLFRTDEYFEVTEEELQAEQDRLRNQFKAIGEFLGKPAPPAPAQPAPNATVNFTTASMASPVAVPMPVQSPAVPIQPQTVEPAPANPDFPHIN